MHVHYVFVYDHVSFTYDVRAIPPALEIMYANRGVHSIHPYVYQDWRCIIDLFQ